MVSKNAMIEEFVQNRFIEKPWKLLSCTRKGWIPEKGATMEVAWERHHYYSINQKHHSSHFNGSDYAPCKRNGNQYFGEIGMEKGKKQPLLKSCTILPQLYAFAFQIMKMKENP